MSISHEAQLKNKLYRNWIKAGLGLIYLKEGSETFVDDELKQLHTAWLASLGVSSGRCNQCTTANVLPCPTRGICYLVKGQGCKYHDASNPATRARSCPNNVCDKIRDNIIAEHHFSKPSWKNTDATKWCTHPWEIAKCFMAETGYQAVSTAAETDCTGILSVFIIGGFMQKVLATVINHATDIFSKNKDARNAIMHSSKLEVTDAQLGQYLDDMVDLLSDGKKLLHHPDAIAARQKLVELKTMALTVSAKDELTILQEKALTAVEKSRKECLEELEIKRLESLEDISKTQEDLFSTAKGNTTKCLEGISAEHKKTLDAARDNADFGIEECTDDAVAKVKSRCDTFRNLLQTSVDQALAVFKQAEVDCQQKQNSPQELRSKIQEELLQCQLDIEVIKAASDKHVEKVTELYKYLQRKSELQKNLSDKYHRHLSSVLLSPVHPEIKTSIIRAYTKLNIINCTIMSNKESTLSRNQQNQTKVNSYKDVFNRDDGKQCRKIFVLGNAGTGKTTWSLNMVDTWLNGLSPENMQDDEDQAIMHEYEFVFYVSLRHASLDRLITDMIDKQLFGGEPHMMQIVREILTRESERCLILLDGLDEWSMSEQNVSIDQTGLPGMSGIEDSTVIITSRPWKIELLRLDKAEMERTVEITGLDKFGVHQLANTVVKELNRLSGNDKNSDEFKKMITEDIEEFLTIPLILNALVCLWYENGHIEHLLANMYSGLIEILIRYAEGDYVSRKKGIPSKLSDIRNLQEIKEQWTDCKVDLPECLSSKKKTCLIYGPLLVNLGKLAFCKLFSGTKGSDLVFTQDSIEEYLSDDELEIALHLGILSQSKVVGSVISRQFSVSFLHKTVQEFLAAVYMVSGDELQKKGYIDIYKLRCKSSKEILETEMVVLFVTGMSPWLTGEITNFVSDQCLDWQVCNMYPSLYTDIMLFKCVEQERLMSTDADHVFIKSHVIRDTIRYIGQHPAFLSNSTRNKKCNIETVDYFNKHKTRCLSLSALNMEPTEDNIAMLCKCLDGIPYLRSLYIFFSSACGLDCSIRLKEAIENIPRIENILLHNLWLKNGAVLNLSNKTMLKRIVCENSNIQVTLSPKHLQVLNMTDAPKTVFLPIIETITEATKSAYFTASGITTARILDLSQCSRLKYLKLERMKICHVKLPVQSCLQKLDIQSTEQEENVFQNFQNQENLERLTLRHVTNMGHLEPNSDNSTCFTASGITTAGILDLSQCSRLNFLKLEYCKIGHVKLPVQSCLEELDINKMEHLEHGENILQNLQNQENLETLSLINVTNIGYLEPNSDNNAYFTSSGIIIAQILDLSRCSRLNFLKLERCQIGHVKLPVQSCLKDLYIVSMLHLEQGENVFQNLQNQENLERLTLTDVTNIGHIEKNSDSSTCFTASGIRTAAILDLSRCSRLNFLNLGCCKIGRVKLPVQSCLKNLDIKGMQPLEHGETVLNLQNQENLEWLTLCGVQNMGHLDLKQSLSLKDITLCHIMADSITLPNSLCSVKLGSFTPPTLGKTLISDLQLQKHLKRLDVESFIFEEEDLKFLENICVLKIWMANCEMPFGSLEAFIRRMKKKWKDVQMIEQPLKMKSRSVSVLFQN